MAGFLDKNTRIIDMVLTGEGKYLLSKGELRFVYWAPFDDEVDYTPFIADSGSMTVAELSASVDRQIEFSPVREATTGYRRLNVSGSDQTNVHRPMFSIPQGQMVIPRMTASDGPTGSIVLETKQQKVSEIVVRRDREGVVKEQLGPFDQGFERFDASVFSLEYGYTKDGFPAGHAFDGFAVRVFRSGAQGLTEVPERRDMANELSYNNDLKVTVDDNSGEDV